MMLTVCFGDSLTRGGNPDNPDNTGKFGYPVYLNTGSGVDRPVLNCGIGGENTDEGLSRIENILDGDYTFASEDNDYTEYNGIKPSTVLLLEGSNDIFQGFTREQTITNLRGMISMCQARNIDIAIGTLPPFSDGVNVVPEVTITPAMSIFWNASIKVLAMQYGIPLVDLWPVLNPFFDTFTYDGIHLDDTMNRHVAESFYQKLPRN